MCIISLFIGVNPSITPMSAQMKNKEQEDLLWNQCRLSIIKSNQFILKLDLSHVKENMKTHAEQHSSPEHPSSPSHLSCDLAGVETRRKRATSVFKRIWNVKTFIHLD